jgi:hypothetical protein
VIHVLLYFDLEGIVVTICVVTEVVTHNAAAATKDIGGNPIRICVWGADLVVEKLTLRGSYQRSARS